MGNYGLSLSMIQCVSLLHYLGDDTRDFDNNVFLPLLSSLDSATLEKIHFSIVPFPLPYHITAHKVVQGLLYVQDQKGDQAALESLRYFLNNINLWDEQTVKTLTINQYMANLAENLSNKYGFDKATIFAQLMHYSEYDKNTRVVAKYAMGALRIPGTPSAYINGVAVDGGTQMNKDQWITLIKSLL